MSAGHHLRDTVSVMAAGDGSSVPPRDRLDETMMPNRHRHTPLSAPSLPFILLLALLAALWLAGGASRGDAAGQVVVRAVSLGALAAACLFGERPVVGTARPVAILLLAMVTLVAVQLVPLPPALWQALPGRAPFAAAADIAGQPQPWRPLAIVPGAALNSLMSLVVPVATFLFVIGLKPHERGWTLPLILVLIVAVTLVGMLQVSGIRLNNPLINDTLGQVGGTFANRNHFALLLAIGCIVAPVWAVGDGRRVAWRGPATLALVLLFLLMILASGSRAGLVVGVLALSIAGAMTHQEIRRTLRRAPRWAFPALITGLVAMVVVFVLLSMVSDRAASIDRLTAGGTGEDMRSRGLPVVLSMIWAYFPIGAGQGGFDPLFRIHEPFALLKRTYFNHAHNDFLEIVLDAGVAGLLVLLAGLGWWLMASLRAWRDATYTGLLPRLGSAVLLLILVASLFDYPARTPMIMAVAMIAAIWLSGAGTPVAGPALPPKDRHL